MIGDFLRRKRVERRITMNDLGRVALLSQPFISIIENEKQFPAVDTFFKIVDTIALLEVGKEAEINKFRGERDIILGDLLFEVRKNATKAVVLEDGTKSDSEFVTDLSIYDEKEQDIISTVELLKDNEAFLPWTDLHGSGEKLKQDEVTININTRLLANVEQVLDLNFIYKTKEKKYLDLQLDGISLSLDEIRILKNTISGFRYSREQNK